MHHKVRSVLFGSLLAAILMLLHTAAAHAIDSSACEQNGTGAQYCEPKIYVWGGDAYGGAYIYPSFGDKEAAMMPFVLATTGAGAYPVYSVRLCMPPPNDSNVCGPGDYTFQDGVDTGWVYAEKVEPPGSASHYLRFGTYVNAIYKCRDGLGQTSGATTSLCSRTDRDGDKDAGPCPYCTGNAGNPVNAGTGNKYEVEADYIAGGTGSLELHRYYNSALTANTGIGARWRTSYDRQITSMDTKGGAPSVMVRRQTGIGMVFTFWGGS